MFSSFRILVFPLSTLPTANDRGRAVTRRQDDAYFKEGQRIARGLTRGDAYLGQFIDDFANAALLALKKEMERNEVRNPAAFMQRKIQWLTLDARRKRKAEISHLKVWDEEVRAIRGKREDDRIDTRNHWYAQRGLSLNIIEKEEQQIANLQAAAIVAIMPNTEDRKLLEYRLYQRQLSISQIARKYSDRSPSSLANFYTKILGTESMPGAATPVVEVIGHLSIATATAYLREIARLDVASVVTDPFAGAISYLELASTYSPEHKRMATIGIARLRWLRTHMPSQRGLPNKILGRLVRAACLYVIEPNDARHDQHSDVGLQDDVKVLEEVFRVVSKYAN